MSLNAFNLNGILADEMGLGKTVQTIAFLLYLKVVILSFVLCILLMVCVCLCKGLLLFCFSCSFPQLCFCQEHGLVKRQHLIVAPTAVLPNWLQEFRIWAPKLSVAEWSARIPLSERAAHFKNKVSF